MHLKKPAVVSVRVTWETQRFLEKIAEKAGVSYSDFVRMALVVGAKHQAWSLGVFDIELDNRLEAIQGRMPSWRERAEHGGDHYYLSDGLIPEDWEATFRKGENG